MHLQSTVLLLSLISFATHISAEQPQPQYPLRNWLSKVSSYISATGWRNPGDVLEGSKAVTAAAVVARRIVPLTLDNWKSTLVGDAATTGLSDDAGNVQEWWVLITGGNRTCYGQCERVEQAWNETAVLFTALPGKTPRQAILDCDHSHLLCSIWSATPPSLWHILVPPPPPGAITARPRTEIYITPLNGSTVTAPQLIGLHQSGSWREQEPYRGAFHPFDGWLATSGLNVPLGYLRSWFAMVPGWTLMLLLTLVSWRVMNQSPGQLARREDMPARREDMPAR